MKNEWNIEDYEITKDLSYQGTIPILVIMIIMIGILLIICKFPFTVFEKVILIKEDNCFQIIIDSLKVSELEEQKYVYIHGKRHKFKILKIDTDYQINNQTMYQTVTLSIENIRKQSNLTSAYLLKYKGTLFQYVMEFMKGGKT